MTHSILCCVIAGYDTLWTGHNIALVSLITAMYFIIYGIIFVKRRKFNDKQKDRASEMKKNVGRYRRIDRVFRFD